mgnify:CR=1 FL=1
MTLNFENTLIYTNIYYSLIDHLAINDCINFFDNDITLSKMQKISIRKGFFHSTKSISSEGTSLFEIESPNDKLDLVRFKDNYGREGKPYEDSKFEFPKEDSCFYQNSSTELSYHSYIE